MRIKVSGSELNRIMKTVGKCLDETNSTRANIELCHIDDKLTIRGTDGSFHAMMSTPVPGGDGIRCCVDGDMFGRILSLQTGDIELITDDKFLTVKGVGRTRLPIVAVEIPGIQPVKGKSIEVSAEAFKICHSHVAYAVSKEPNRIQLTGILNEITKNELQMVALDGFQMAIEKIACKGKDIRMIIPGAFMELVTGALANNKTLKLVTDEKRLMAETDNMRLCCGLIIGNYIEYERLIPSTFATETLVNAGAVKSALKSGSIAIGKQKLVKIEISESELTIMNNSESVDFEADIPCATTVEGLKIAFNNQYLLNTMNAIDAEEVVIRMNSPTSPAIIRGKDDKTAVHMCLPVRVFMGEGEQ